MRTNSALTWSNLSSFTAFLFGFLLENMCMLGKDSLRQQLDEWKYFLTLSAVKIKTKLRPKQKLKSYFSQSTSTSLKKEESLPQFSSCPPTRWVTHDKLTPTVDPSNILKHSTNAFLQLCLQMQPIYLDESLEHVSQWQEGNEAIVLVGEYDFLRGGGAERSR